MKGLYLLLKRFVHPYKRYVVAAFVFNVLGALFGAFQFATIQPVLGVLFKTQNIVAKPAEWSLLKGDKGQKLSREEIEEKITTILAKQLQLVIPGFKIIFMSGYSSDVRSSTDVMTEGVNFIQETIKAAFTGWGSIAINASSSVIFAGDGKDFAEKAAEEARLLYVAMADALNIEKEYRVQESLIIPGDPLTTLKNCDGYYNAINSEGKLIGPLVAYNGTYDTGIKSIR